MLTIYFLKILYVFEITLKCEKKFEFSKGHIFSLLLLNPILRENGIKHDGAQRCDRHTFRIFFIMDNVEVI